MKPQGTLIYKCPVCQTVVEVLANHGMELVCCGPQMECVRDTPVQGDDDHAMTLERTACGTRVRVGASGHAMDVDHHIQWIELLTAGRSVRQFLAPGELPEAVFAVTDPAAIARCYCTVHGLRRSPAKPVPEPGMTPCAA